MTTQNQNVERDKIIDRIRKLSAMATSANEAEAQAFAEKAQALLLEHNLTMLDIHEKETEDEETIMDSTLVTDPQPWRRQLANAVADMYLCSYFFTRGTLPNGKTKCDIHNFVGSQGNVAVAKIMFVYLYQTVNRLARQGAARLPKHQGSPYRVSFRGACTLRLCARIRERIVQAKKGGIIKREGSGSGNLPALLSLYERADVAAQAFIDKRVGKLVTPKRMLAHDLDTLGMIEGTMAGNKIGLDTQVGNGEGKRKSIGSK